MTVGDLVRVKAALHGWGSKGIVIKIDREYLTEAPDKSLTVHILGLSGKLYTWYDWQLEVINEDG